MPELRKDPIVNRWVVFSAERAERPTHYRISHSPAPSDGALYCPFCPEHENETPPEVFALPGGRAATADWQLRVIPNRFPALGVEGELQRSGDGLYDRLSGIGAHEVIIEHPSHSATLTTLSHGEIERVLYACRERILDLKRDVRFRSIVVFKNWGAAAGATISHSHSQLIALPVVPKTIAEELEGTREHHARTERCLFCDILHQELHDRSRLIWENSQFVVLAPYAPRFPFETWILPRAHRSHFEEVGEPELLPCAEALSQALLRLSRALDQPPYNLVLHSAPFGEPRPHHYHWHIEIIPKLGHIAGFEWGSGFFINPTLPEAAARFLRELDL